MAVRLTFEPYKVSKLPAPDASRFYIRLRVRQKQTEKGPSCQFDCLYSSLKGPVYEDIRPK